MLTQSLELALSVIHVITERHCIKCVHIILITIEVTAQLLNYLIARNIYLIARIITLVA